MRELHDAAKAGDLTRLTQLLDVPGCDVEERYVGQTAIHYASKGCHTEAVKLLLDRKADVNAKAITGWSAIHCAAERDNTEALALLLDRGADVNAQAAKKISVLHFAAFNGRMAATTLLVAKGADLHAKDEDGYTPLDDAKYRGREGCACVRDTSDRQWEAVAAFLERLLTLEAAERVAFAERAWEVCGRAFLLAQPSGSISGAWQLSTKPTHCRPCAVVGGGDSARFCGEGRRGAACTAT